MSDILDCLKLSLPTGLYKEVAEQYEQILRNSGGNVSHADAGLAEWLPTYRDGVKRARLNNAMAGVRLEESVVKQLGNMERDWAALSGPAKRWSELVRSTSIPTRANATERILNLADVNARRSANELLGQLSALYQRAAPKGIMLDADRTVMTNVVSGLIDGVHTVKNAEVKQIVMEMRKVLDDSIVSYKQAGGMVGDIKNYVPIRHNASKIGDVSEDVWYQAYRAMTDISKVVDYKTGKFVSEARFREIASDMYADIISNGGARKAKQMQATQKSLRFKNVDMFSRRMQARLSSPVDAAAFKQYNDAFGVGDEGMFDLIVSNIEGIGRDTGVMEIMGSMPTAQADHLAAKVGVTGNPNDRKRIDALYRTLVGSWEGSVDTILSRSSTNLHNFMSSSLLGGASLAAIGDRVFIKNAARLNGLTGGRELGAFLNTLVGKPDEIVRSLHIAEALAHTSVSRFDGSMGITPTGRMMTGLNNLKNMNHRVSGLQQMTLATGDSLTMTFFGDLGDLVKKGTSWDDINPQLKNLFDMFEVDAVDWQRMVSNGVDKRGFITPDGLPDDMSNIAQKLNNVNLQLRTYATNSPDLRQRMYSTGNKLGPRVRGDVGHVISQLGFQFKSFPMMVWRNHFVPNMTRMMDGDVTPMAMTMMTGMFYGSLIVQLKAMLKGEEMRDWDDKELWMKSFVQFGGGGLLGDALFKDPNAYGRNLMQELSGPGLSASADVATQMSKMLWNFAAMDEDKDMDWGAMVRASKPFLPLSTLWYLRAAMDHMFWDSLTGALDDDYYANAKRQKATMQEERGGAGWWSKGDFTPQGYK